MNDVVSKICKLSSNSNDLIELNKLLKENEKTLQKFNVGNLDEGMARLDVSQHTLGFLTLLFFKGECFGEVLDHMQVEQLDFFSQQIKLLFLHGDGYQMRLAPAKVGALSRKFAQAMVIRNSCPEGIYPLKRGVEKLVGTNKNLLTPVHSGFVLCCLKSKNYRAALPILNCPIFNIDPKDNGLVPLDFLTYHYYGGLLYAGLQQFEESLEMFQIAMTCPGEVLSHVQVEAFKRYVLLCLLVHEEFISLPSTVSRSTSSNVEKLCAPYMELAKAYKKGSEQFVKVIEKHADAFLQDRCFGLVKQVQSGITRRKIQKLTHTYITLSLSDIAQSAGLSTPEAAEEHVLDMIAKGDIFAKINQKDGMLSFLEDPEDYNNTQMVQKLNQKIQDVVVLTKKLSEVNTDILLHPNALKSEVMEIKAQQASAGESSKPPSAGGNMSIEEQQVQMALQASMHS